MQKSPAAWSLVSRSQVIGWKYDAKGSWAKPPEPGVRQCAHRHAENLPARIATNPLALRLPAVKRLLQMSSLRYCDHCQKNGKNASDRDALLRAG